jgi:UDP-glucuronate decarboxylase
MLELAQKVIQITGSKSQLVFSPLPQDDPKQRQPSIDLAKKNLSWEPTISLDRGLLDTIEYFRRFV